MRSDYQRTLNAIALVPDAGTRLALIGQARLEQSLLNVMDERMAQMAAFACPKAERIIAKNHVPVTGHGVDGFMQIRAASVDPRHYKEEAAKAILAQRGARAALGRAPKGVFWLERAAFCRRRAAELLARSAA